jgi:hypothetical protein
MEDVFQKLRETREEGQQEYAHQDDKPFANFEDGAEGLPINRLISWWILFHKHVRGIKAYIGGHRSQREGIRGRIKDAILYLILLWAMLDEESGMAPPAVQHELDKKMPTTSISGTLRLAADPSLPHTR